MRRRGDAGRPEARDRPDSNRTSDQSRKLGVLRQCYEVLNWLHEARSETLTSLWTLRDLFANPPEVARNWTSVAELMDQTFNVLLRGNQLIADVLRGLTDLEGDDPAFRSILAQKLEMLDATGTRAVRAIRRFAGALDPSFFRPGTRPASPPKSLDGDAPSALLTARRYLDDLEAVIRDEERQLLDLEAFLALRGRDVELGLAW